MKRKDLMYYFREISFIDDPFYFLGRALKIRNLRNEFLKNQKQTHEEIERLRLLKNRAAITPEEVLQIEEKISDLTGKRLQPFNSVFEKQICPDDWISKKCFKIERRTLMVQHCIAVMFIIVYKGLNIIRKMIFKIVGRVIEDEAEH